MKNLVFYIILSAIFQVSAFAQKLTLSATEIEGKEVYSGEDVVFHQIDNHTWVGTGKLIYNESLYLLEGKDKAVLIDAGTKIADLDKIVASITKKPVMLVATHVHPDHTGPSINSFPEIYLNQADTAAIPRIMPDYKGKIKYLKDGEIIDLGGRKVEVVFTPGHTPGSTTFFDKEAGYGFSGDSFGSGNLLLTVNFSTLIATCEKTIAFMDKYGIKYLYPGHFFGKNLETGQRLKDMITLSKDVLSGKLKGDDNPGNKMLNLIISGYGVRINYKAEGIK